MTAKCRNPNFLINARSRRVTSWVSGADRKRPEVANVLGARTDGAAAHRIKEVTSRNLMSVWKAERSVRDEGYDIGEMTLTSLMLRYTKLKKFKDARRCYEQLLNKNKGVLSLETLNTALYLAVCQSDLKQSMTVWNHIKEAGHPHTPEAYTNIIMLHRNLGRHDNAVKAYQQMKIDGVTPSLHSLSVVLKSVTDPKVAKELVGDREIDDYVRTDLVRILSHSGKFDEAFNIAAECQPNTLTRPVVWTQLGLGIAVHPSVERYNWWFKNIDLYVTHPDIQLYGAALKCIRSIVIASTTDRETQRCLEITSKVLLRVSKHSSRWPKDTLRSGAVPFWLNLFSIYYTARDLGKLRELNSRLTREGVKIPSQCASMLEVLEKDMQAPQEVQPKAIPGSKNKKKDYLHFA